jgi:hypothetical protein
MKANLVTIGLRAKTGRAIAVVLGGSSDLPQVVSKLEIKLVDPKVLIHEITRTCTNEPERTPLQLRFV